MSRSLWGARRCGRLQGLAAVVAIVAAVGHDSSSSNAGDAEPYETRPLIAYQDEAGIRALIKIHAPSDIAAKRRALVNYIWKRNSLPVSALPDEVHENVSIPWFSNWQEVARVDKLVVRMEQGFESHIYHLFPKGEAIGAVIVHGGHGSVLKAHTALIKRLLRLNYAVFGIDMPLYGKNKYPDFIDTPNMGLVKIRGAMHQELALLETDNFTAIKLFLHPILVALNHGLVRHGYEEFAMVGYSGGGWSTALYAAVDTRIRKSFAVAGSSAFYLLYVSGSGYGDFEQTWPLLYSKANYLEIYVLGASGPGRRLIQVHNKFDTCCFYGMGGTTYASIVAGVVSDLGQGGRFSYVLDDTHKAHAISKSATDMIIAELAH